jgi:hypothetical protein
MKHDLALPHFLSDLQGQNQQLKSHVGLENHHLIDDRQAWAAIKHTQMSLELVTQFK